MATLQEIETSWSLVDVLEANEAIDAYAEALEMRRMAYGK